MTKESSEAPTSGLLRKLLDKYLPPKRNALGVKKQLAEQFRSLKDSSLIDPEVYSMLVGVTEVSELQVRDIMIPRSQMIVLDREDSIEELIKIVIKSGHSRFPVIGEDKDEVIGIFLAKDLLRRSLSGDKTEFNINDFLRLTVFIPESMKLDKLLAQFRESKSHLAVVVDEFGGVSGLATIEDVLEQIVGDIDDEHDVEEKDVLINIGNDKYKIKATYRIDEFNEYFDVAFNDDDYDTLGGLMVHHLGHLPRQGERLTFQGFKFRAVKTDRRRIHVIELENMHLEPS
jgi:magnesium and cobalt transporter